MARKDLKDRKGQTLAAKTTPEDARQDAKNIDFSDPAACKSFEEKHEVHLNQQPDDTADLQSWQQVDHGVLHLVAQLSGLSGYEAFVRWAIDHHRQLLRCRGGQGRLTPLHYAIAGSNHEFVGLVLEMVADIKDLLDLETKDKETCLHYAIMHRSPFTEEIINRALKSFDKPGDCNDSTRHPDDSRDDELPSARPGCEHYFTGAVTNGEFEGMTALHIAVSLDLNSTNDKVFEDLVSQSAPVSSVVKIAKEHKQGGTQSPVNQPNQLSNIQSTAQVTSAIGSNIPPNFKAPRRVLTGDRPLQPKAGDVEIPKKNLDLLKAGKKFDLRRVVIKLINANRRVLVECRDAEEETPFQARLTELMRQATKSSKLNPVEKEKLRHKTIESDIILSDMRTYIIEHFYRKDAMTALYKVGKERVLEFDLSGLPHSTIDSEFLKGLRKVLRFEGMLKYVALPRLSVEVEGVHDGDVGNTEYSQATKRKGNGLQDMCTIFKWLRTCHVTKVLKVTVVDNQEPSHSDEAIETCVRGLDIRSWNWYKFDLCSDVLESAAPNLQDATLYSSGNNAVLLGWSSSAGLAKLQMLKKIHVFVQEGLERPERLKKNMKTFGERLLEQKPDIKFTWSPHKLDEDRDAIFTNRVADKSTDSTWMRPLKSFASFLRSDVCPASPVPDIKIAIIDDGIDTTLDIFSGRIQLGDSFYQLGELSGRRGAYYVPSGAHGTLMAALICEVLPPVRLYIAQLEVLRTQDGRRSFTAESATEAIGWAVDQGVDIISMSWSIRTDGNLPLLDAALKRASDDNIVMFCASIDEGSTAKDNTYPGKHPSCIKIGACDSAGHKLSWVSEANSRFFLPGDAMQPISESGFWSRSQMGLAGSSVSTALAAGLAGLLLYCDRLTDRPKVRAPLVLGGLAKSLGRAQDVKEVDDLRWPNNMIQVFTELARGSEANKVPQLWDYLPKSDELKWEKGEQNLETKKLLRELMDRLRK